MAGVPVMFILVVASLCFAVTLPALRGTGLRRLFPLDGRPLDGRPLNAGNLDYKLQSSPKLVVGGVYSVLGIALCIGMFPLLPWLRAGPASSRAFAVLAALVLALVVGMLDDARKPHGLAWPVKLVGQWLAASCYLAIPDAPVAAIVAIPWLIVCMNAWNFLDNTDGAAAATGLGSLIPLLIVLAGTMPAVDSRLAAALTGVLAGLVPFNWPRAHAYLGDGGAHVLGLFLGLVALDLYPAGGAAAMLAIHALPLLDFVQVLYVRICLGVPPWRGDRRHLAHRLQRVMPVAWIAPAFFAIQALATTLGLTR